MHARGGGGGGGRRDALYTHADPEAHCPLPRRPFHLRI